jgi:hypothetical protein
MSGAIAMPITLPVQGLRKNGTNQSLKPGLYIPNEHLGKQWHEPKKAFRPTAGLTSYEKRAEKRKEQEATKAREKEMKEEKAATRQVCRQWLGRVGHHEC